MAFDDDPFADLIPGYQSIAQEDDPFADLIPQEPTGLAAPQDAGVSASDYGRAVMAGGGQLISGAGWGISKIPYLEDVGKGMQRAGEQASDFWVKGDPNAQFLGAGMSPAARAEQSKEWVKESDDGSGFLGYEMGDAGWHTAGLSAAQSLLGTAAGMGVGGGLTKGLQAAGVGAKTAGVIGYGAGEAGVAAGSAGHEAYRSIMEMPVEKLAQHPEFQELTRQSGGNPDAVKEQIANLAAGQAAATVAGTTFALSAPMGALIGKILSGVPIATTKPRAIGTAAAGEAGQEFMQSGAEQIAQNKAIQDYADQSRGLSEDVLNAAIGGAAAGGVMGGVLGSGAGIEVKGERDAIAGIKGIAENFAFDQLSDEQLDNAIKVGGELNQKYKDPELKSALDALAAEKILRAADRIVPPGQQAPQQGSQAAPAEQIIGAEPEDDVATDPNALPQEPPGFFGQPTGLTMPGAQQPAQTTPPPDTTGYQFTGQAPTGFDPFADLVPSGSPEAEIDTQTGLRPAGEPQNQQTGLAAPVAAADIASLSDEDFAAMMDEQSAPQPIDPAILRQQKAKDRYKKSAKIDEREDNLGRIVAKLGGILSDEAEQNGFDKHDFRGYGWKIMRAFNKGDKADTLDGMRERLNGYGFDFPDTNSLIEALREDMAGRKIYTPVGYEAQMEMQEREEPPEQGLAAPAESQLGPYGQYDPPIDEYTGDMYEPEDAESGEPEYDLNWSEEAREIYELLEEASAIDKQAAMDIWESGRDERDVAVSLYDFIRNNRPGAQGDRGEGTAQPGVGAQTEAPGTAGAPAQGLTRPDLLGDDTRTAQAVVDAQIKKDQKPAEEPALVQSGDELFANNGKLEPDLFDTAANEAATSPKNNLPEPTKAQIEAGNYRKGHASIYGLDISIENPKGSTRSGTDSDGESWNRKMKSHYGYIKGSVGRDKDHVDVFIGDGAEKAKVAYVVDQIDPKTGKFDEHKIVMTADGIEAAEKIYLDNYPSGWNGMGSITAMPIDEFKAWVKDQERTKKPVAYTKQAKPIQDKPTRKASDIVDISDAEFAAMMDEAAPAPKAEGSETYKGKRWEASGWKPIVDISPILKKHKIQQKHLDVLTHVSALGDKGALIVDVPRSLSSAFADLGMSGHLERKYKDKGPSELIDEGYPPTEAEKRIPSSEGRAILDDVAAAMADAKYRMSEEIAKEAAPAPKAPKPATAALKSAVKHAAAGASESIAALDALFGGPGKLSSGLTFDEESYNKAKPHFKKALEEFIAAGEDLVSFVRYALNRWGDNVKPYLMRFHQDVKASKIKIRGIHDDADSAASQEPDSTRTGDQTPVDEAATGDDGRGAGRPGERAGAEAGEGRAPEQGDNRVPGPEPTVDREPSDTDVSTETGEFTLTGRHAGPADAGRSSATGGAGVPVDTRTSGQSEEVAHAFHDSIAEKRKRQAASNSIPVKNADLANIKETLPFLLPDQHGDVLKAENRFANGGVGMMFTNGTGTGKTYTGLGIVKRHIRQTGDDNVLILVPTDPKAKDWIEDAANLQIEATQLKDKKDPGKGVVVTTYANFRDNWELQARNFSLVMPDESHYLGQSEKQKNAAYYAFRAIANHADGMYHKAMFRDNGLKNLEYGRRRHVLDGIKAEVESRARENNFSGSERLAALRKIVSAEITDSLNEEWANRNDQAYQDGYERARAAQNDLKDQYHRSTKAVFLSASPFAYHDSLDYAEGFIYDYAPENRETRGGWHHRDQKTNFFMANLGYRFRYGKLTKPDADVDVGLMERRLNEQFKQAGSLSGRMLEVDYDYSRDFVVFNSELGRKIDRGLNVLHGMTPDGEYKSKAEMAEMGLPIFEVIQQVIQRKHTPIYMAQLMESIKASHLGDHVQQHLDLGRKVVVFHDYQKSIDRHPFDLGDLVPPRAFDDASQMAASEELRAEIDAFHAAYPEMRRLPLSGMSSVVESLQNKFGDRVRVINGRVSNKEKTEAKRLFNNDDSGVDIIVVQRQSGREGISLHDVTQKHQRALVDMGLPVAPVDSLQTEGRVYRYGVMSDAVIEYPVLQTGFERRTFAYKVATRARTAENLAMGNLARDMESAFKDGYIEASEMTPNADQGKGGKERDRATREDSPWDTAKALYFGRERQSGRRDQRQGVDYFSTPEPLGLKMVEWAGIRPGERALEPSAGHGAIARWFPEDSRNVFIEPSSSLATEVALLANGESKTITFEDFQQGTYFDAIVMNPPFGSGGATAIRHLEKAMKHLKNGGRVVALIPEGPAADKKLDKLLYGEEGELEALKAAVKAGRARQSEYDARRRILENYYVMADIGLPRVTFERAGTTVKAHILIIDRYDNPSDVPYRQQRRDYDQESIREFFDAIEIANGPARGEVQQDTQENELDDADVLRQAGITIDQLHSKWIVAGKTFDHRDAMRRLGGEWNRASKDWEFSEDPAANIVAYLRRPESLNELVSAMPTQAAAPAVPTQGGEGLAAYGLTVTKGETRTGKDVWSVTGNTREHKDVIKAAGGRWWSPTKSWSFYRGDPTERLLEALNNGGVNEETGLYLAYERETSAVQSKQKSFQANPAQATLDLLAPAGLPAEESAAQAVDNFNTIYKQVKVGELPSAFDTINSPEEAAHALASIRKHAQETMMAVVLDDNNSAINIIRHTKGIKDASNVSPVELIAAVAATPGARSVWFAHNHPSGLSEPSNADTAITKRLYAALEGANIEFMGHLVVAGPKNYSVMDKSGYLDSQVSPKPGIRRKSLAVTERMLRKSPPLGRQLIDSPKSAIGIINGLETESGVLLVDNRHHVLGVIALTPDEMAELRSGNRVRRILESLDKTNAAAVIPYSKESHSQGALNNLANYLARLGDLRVLDIMPTDMDGDLYSRTERGQSLGSASEPFFSVNPAAVTGAVLPHDAVKRIVDNVRGALVEPGFNIQVVPSESALPHEVQDRAAKDKATGYVKAVYHKGSVYLVSPQFSSRIEVEEALAHELSGHYGGRILFDKDLQAAYQRMYFSLGLKGVREIAKKNGIDMAHYFKTASEMPAVDRPFYIIDELLAHLQGERVYDSLPDRFKRVVREFWGAVRDRLRRMGLTSLSEYSDSDLALLLKRMRQAAKDGNEAKKTGVPAFMVAWHGSPYDHDKFSTEKIGTGEGAQAYGWGLYFATRKEVAEWYKKNLTSPVISYKGQYLSKWTTEKVPEELSDKYGNIAVRQAVATLENHGGDIDAAIKGLTDFAASVDEGHYYTMAADFLKNERNDLSTSGGKLYQVELAPKEDEYLLWDESLSDQSDFVRDALGRSDGAIASLNRRIDKFVDRVSTKSKDAAKLVRDMIRGPESVRVDSAVATANWHKLRELVGDQMFLNESNEFDFNDIHDLGDELVEVGFSGERIYNGIADYLDQGGGQDNSYKHASTYLHSLGIRGIKYLDGSSRRKGEGAYNYVIFNEEDVTISAKFARRSSPGVLMLNKLKAPLRPSSGNVVTVRQAAEHLKSRMDAAYPDGLDINNEADIKTAVNIAATEVRYQLEAAQSGHDWYNIDIGESFWLAGHTVPRLHTDPNLRVIMSAVAAASSYQQRAHVNWQIATRIMEIYEATGEIPHINPANGLEWGPNPATGKQLQMIQKLIDHFGSEAALARWMLTEHSLAEIATLRRDTGLYFNGDTSRPLTQYRPSQLTGQMGDPFAGAFILGPKGGPFMLNLNGFEETTGDVWFARTVGRYFGSLLDESRINKGNPTIGGPNNQERRVMQRITREVGRRLGLMQQDVQAVLWFFEQRLYSQLGAGNGARRFSEGAQLHLASRQITPRRRPEDWHHDGRSVLQAEVSPAGRGEEEDVAFSKAAPQTETKAFKDWFGDSKVVDDDGNPLVVYHGTSFTDIESFRPEGGKDGDWQRVVDWFRKARKDNSKIGYMNFRSGTFFSPKPDYAGHYTGENTGVMYPVYIKAENPIYWDQRTKKATGIDPNKTPDALILHTDGDINEVAVIDPTQIKSATGNRGTFDPEDDRIAFSRGAPRDPEEADLYKKLGLLPKKGGVSTFVDRVRNTPWGDLKRHMADEWTQGALDRFYGIKRAEQEYGGMFAAEQSGYVATRLSTGLSSVVTATLHYGTPEWNRGILQKIPNSKGLLEIFEPLGEDINAWLAWMGAKRAERLARENREKNLTDKNIRKGLSLDAGREQLFQDVADEYAEFMGRILDIAEGAGLIGRQDRAMWEHADYVPFYRMQQNLFTAGPKNRKGISHQTAGIRRLTGADMATNDLLENIIMNVTHLLDASMKNNALKKTTDNLAGSGLFTDASMEFKPAIIPMSQVKRIVKDGLRADGWDEMSIDQYIDSMPPEAIDGLRKMWSMKAPADPDVVRVMVGGKAKYYRVSDPLLLRALTQINTDKMGGIVDVMRSFKRILTAGVTASPEFMLRNFIRDAVHAWAINEDGFTLGVDSVRGVRKTMKLWSKTVDHTATGGAIDMMFAGGSFLGGYIHGTDPAETARSIRAALRKRGFTQAAQDDFLGTVVDTSAKYWDRYREIGDAIENASREATYEASISAGKSKAQAIFDAKDLMDYSMQGQWAIFQFMGDTVPFFNARVQGLYKLKRAGAVPGWGSKGAVIQRGTMIAGASLALLALNWDDDRYEELEDWDKDIYWHFWLGDQHLRIPKPFEIGVIYGTIPERMARLAFGKDNARKAIKQLWWNFAETFNLVGMPQIIAPAAEIYANKDSFTKRPIEGMADEGKLKSARYNEYTSETMRAIGTEISDTVKLSPKELEHLWQGYLGTLGMYILGASDLVVRWASDAPEAPDWRVDDYPVIKSFVRGDPPRSTRYRTELYEMLREVEQTHRTILDNQKKGMKAEAEELITENAAKLKTRKPLRKAADELMDLRDKVDQIYRDRAMPGDEKRRRIDELMEKGSVASRRAVEKAHPYFNQ